MVVHHSHCLHMGVNDRGTHESESTAFQVFAQRIGFRRGGGNLLHDSPAVYFRLSTDKAPRVRIKTSELLLNREKRTRIAYSRLDLLPISNDSWIKGNVGCAFTEGRHLDRYDVEPGNVRELQNVIERVVILSEGETLATEEGWLKRELRGNPKRSGTLHGSLLKQEKEMIEAALTASQGRISGPSGAAAKLGLPSRTLDSKIKRLKINVYRFKTPR